MLCGPADGEEKGVGRSRPDHDLTHFSEVGGRRGAIATYRSKEKKITETQKEKKVVRVGERMWLNGMMVHFIGLDSHQAAILPH